MAFRLKLLWPFVIKKTISVESISGGRNKSERKLSSPPKSPRLPRAKKQQMFLGAFSPNARRAAGGGKRKASKELIDTRGATKCVQRFWKKVCSLLLLLAFALSLAISLCT